MICSALGEVAVTHKTCKKWFQRFRNGNFDLSDRKRPGQPKKFEDKELEQLLEENPTHTETELAHAIGVTQQAISSRLHRLGRIQKAGRWVQRQATGVTPEGKSYSNGKRTYTRSLSYSASNFSSLASTRKNSKGRPMDSTCKVNNLKFIY